MPAPSQPVIELCRAQGFALAGVCAARASEFGPGWREWLAEGRHGSMSWLAEYAEVREDPTKLLAGALSIIMVADQYALRGDADEPAPGTGKVARYARGLDYHKQMKRRLFAIADALREAHPGHEFRAFVDTAPIFEREHAVRAGLGWVGKHTLLIHPRLGSYVLLGGIITTLQITQTGHAIEDHCGTCTRCIDACPTDAITPYSVDASRCISYLTIERRAPIDGPFHERIGEWVFGCDICQEVCPHNSARSADAEVGSINPAHTPKHRGLDLLELLEWRAEDRTARLSGSAMKRATLDMLRRNAVIAAGNALARRPDPELRARVEAIAADAHEPEMVREAARAAAARSP